VFGQGDEPASCEVLNIRLREEAGCHWSKPQKRNLLKQLIIFD
jgi:hypothetical protein